MRTEHAAGSQRVVACPTASEEFIINTPTETSQKFLIGNGTTADHATVFAQLYIGDECKGVHAFIVPIRDGCVLASFRCSPSPVAPLTAGD